MIDKGLYKRGRVGLKGGADAATASFGASAGYSDPKTGSTGKADPKGGFNLGGGQGPTFGGAKATQTSGDRGRESRQEFIRNIQKTNPKYTGGPTKEPSSLGKFLSGIFSLLPGMNILKGILGPLNQRLRNTDFGRSKNLMDYLDMKKFGGYDEREMARRIRMQEAANLQKRINAGEFGGLDTMLNEVALTTGSSNQDFNRMFDVDKISNLINTGGITNTKVEPPDFMFASPQFQQGLDNSMYGGDRMLFGANNPNELFYYGDVLPDGSIIQTDADGITNYDFDTPVKVGPENTGFIEVQDPPYYDEFFDIQGS